MEPHTACGHPQSGLPTPGIVFFRKSFFVESFRKSGKIKGAKSDFDESQNINTLLIDFVEL